MSHHEPPIIYSIAGFFDFDLTFLPDSITVLLFFSSFTRADVGTPPQTYLIPVADSMFHNGFAVSIQSFKSRLAVNDLMEFYRANWVTPSVDGAVPAFIQNEQAPWEIISKVSGDRLTVVQARTLDDGGSEGFISITKINSAPSRLLEIRLPADAEILSNTGSQGRLTTARTVVMKHRSRNAEALAEYFIQSLQADDWILLDHRRIYRQQVILFNRKNDSLSVLTRTDQNGGSIAVINRVNSDG